MYVMNDSRWMKMLMTVLGMGLLAMPVSAADQQKPMSAKEQMSYSMGVNVVRSIQQQDLEYDLETVIQGMRDAAAGKKLLMSDDELRKNLLAIQNEVRRKQKMAPIIAAKEGQSFLAENKKKEGVVVRPSGLQYKVLNGGDGKRPTDENLVLCNYRGTLLNGTEFDRSFPGKPVTFSVREGGGMAGVSEALKLMPVGSRWQLFIPPQLAYGERGRMSAIGSPVGPNETIIVDLELLAIK